MDSRYVSSTDMNILLSLLDMNRTVTELSEISGLSLPTISGSVKHLKEIGLVSVLKEGRVKYICLTDSDVGDNFRTFVVQNPNLNPVTLFRGNGLMILTSLIGNGSSLQEIGKRTGISRSTISRYIGKWRSTGILWKEGHGGKIRINSNYPDLEAFLGSFLKYRMETKVKNEIDKPLILFNDGETLLFAHDGSVDDPEYQPAGYTYLAMEGFDVVPAKEYYRLSLHKERIDTSEAVVQAIRSDMLNPRPRKILRDHLMKSKINVDELMEYAKKYGIESIIEDEVKKYEREDLLQKERPDRDA